MSVVVQEMVAADAAGVMFTVNPINGEARELASYGLGEAVVSGSLTPDTYTIAKESVTIQSTVATMLPVIWPGFVQRRVLICSKLVG